MLHIFIIIIIISKNKKDRDFKSNPPTPFQRAMRLLNARAYHALLPRAGSHDASARNAAALMATAAHEGPSRLARGEGG